MLRNVLAFIAAFILVLLIANSAASACGKYVTLSYKVTHIEDDQYWGIGLTDGSNVYFVKENIISDDVLNVGDVVLIYFDVSNLEDGILMIDKLEQRK